MNVLLKKIMLELLHLSFVISIGSWTRGTLYRCLGKATTIASFKKGVKEFLEGNVGGFLIILILILLIFFFLCISQYAFFEFLIVCLLNLVFMI